VPWVDLTELELREYRIATAEPDGLDAWWSERLDRARSLARPVTLDRYGSEIYGPLEVYDVEFSGAGGDRIRGWYLRPAGSSGRRLPVMVTFGGYGCGRGSPVEHALLPAVGFGHFVMDIRDQGRGHSVGNPNGQSDRLIIRGITDPDTYYFTRLFLDAVRAVEAVAELPGVEPDLIGVGGGSQGGGLALAAAALSGGRVKVCHAEVPMFCDFQRAITVSPRVPYIEVATYLDQHVELAPAALDTLRYVDCALLARRITASCLLSVGLRDEVCPPSTVYAAYHEIRAPKELAVSELGDHRVPPDHTERKLRHLRENLRPNVCPVPR
jgi:cephalosporin-C deacetylase